MEGPDDAPNRFLDLEFLIPFSVNRCPLGANHCPVNTTQRRFIVPAIGQDGDDVSSVGFHRALGQAKLFGRLAGRSAVEDN